MKFSQMESDFLMYSKGHYEESGDMMADLCKLRSNYYYSDPEHIERDFAHLGWILADLYFRIMREGFDGGFSISEFITNIQPGDRYCWGNPIDVQGMVNSEVRYEYRKLHWEMICKECLGKFSCIQMIDGDFGKKLHEWEEPCFDKLPKKVLKDEN